MSSADPRSILKIPGRLVKDPTDLTADFPHGGTELGIVRERVFRVIQRRQIITANEFGLEPAEVIESGQTAVFACTLRGFDVNAVAQIFPDVVTSTDSGFPVIRYPGSARAGELASGRAFKLLFSPRNTEEHPGFVFYNAIPLMAETMEMDFSADREFGINVVFQAIRDNATPPKVYQIGLLADLD